MNNENFKIDFYIIHIIELRFNYIILYLYCQIDVKTIIQNNGFNESNIDYHNNNHLDIIKI